MRNHLDTLKKCPLFAAVDEEHLLKMLTCLGARIETFDKKYTIMAESRPAKYIGILLAGKAQVVQMDYYGNRSILTEITPPDVFGEAFACAEVKSIPV